MTTQGTPSRRPLRRGRRRHRRRGGPGRADHADGAPRPHAPGAGPRSAASAACSTSPPAASPTRCWSPPPTASAPRCSSRPRPAPITAVGIDLVAMCVNDLVVQGAQPLFFLDYFATGGWCPTLAGRGRRRHRRGLPPRRLRPDRRRDRGDAGPLWPRRVRPRRLRGRCRRARRRCCRAPTCIADGDVVLGLASSGVHANGFSLVRLVLREQGLGLADPCPWSPTATARRARCWRRPGSMSASCLAAIAAGGVQGAGAHHRRRPDREPAPRAGRRPGPASRRSAPGPAAGLRLAGQAGRLDTMELLRTFNCGIGMILVVDPGRVGAASPRARGRRRDGSHHRHASPARPAAPRVEFAGLATAWPAAASRS